MMSDIKHYGMPRRSGRYPWGSGGNAYQTSKDWLAYIDDLKKQGLTETRIAKSMNISTKRLRARVSIANSESRKDDVAEVWRLKNKGYSNVAIGEKMGINESTVRSLLDPAIQERSNATRNTADMLRKNVDKHKYLDVGAGTERHMDITRTKLDTALALLEEESGYKVQFIQVPQLGTGKMTNLRVLTSPDVEYKELYANKDKIRFVTDRSEDGGITYIPLEPPKSVNSKRIKIQYTEDGGSEKDGLVELRRGVDDISLGKALYAQVRISVDDTHYIKGMAVYSDDLPPGVDIRFNTSKDKSTPMLGDKNNSVLKPLKDDPENPFGASIKREENLLMTQRHYIDKNGKKQLSTINIVNEQGDWDSWEKSLSSQMLSKQYQSVAKKQLKQKYDIMREEYDEIMSLTNPAVRKQLLQEFSDNCDSAASHLKAAAFPRQASKVIIPITSLKDNEIYAPGYRDGEEVALIRYPHGGTFEIPVVRVNNSNRKAKDTIGNGTDAVAINYKVAQVLSGADFDGDTVLIIPTKGVPIKHSSPLKGLKDFDPKTSYSEVPGMKLMGTKGGGQTGQKMGDISNLITDMTIKGASDDEICRAVRHSMVVIDAEKHRLNYTKSYDDNGIAALKEKYQGGARRGASTLISKASSEERVDERSDYYKIDAKTGEKVYRYTGESYKNDKGKTVKAKTVSTKMAEIKDAHTLSSGTVIESVYADHANKLKALANESRKAILTTPSMEKSSSAAKTYAKEVASLEAQLDVARRNAPLERQAQLLGNAVYDAKVRDNPGMTKEDKKKAKNQALAQARVSTGAKKQSIKITSKEWEAIQAGAITQSKLLDLLKDADMDIVRQHATPRTKLLMSTAKIQKAKTLLGNGNTLADVADALGVSVSTLTKSLD